ncbi:MAG: BON domain-containing protein [Alphaproteobacteria bacterium]
MRLPLYALALAVTLSSTATLLASCAAPALALGAAATAGYVGFQARPAEQIAKDTKIKLNIKDKLTAMKFNYLSDVGVDVFMNDVLLTGIIPTKEDGEAILDVARRTEGVAKVYNELFVGAPYSTTQKAKDAWIATQIQPRLVGDRETFPLNYLINVVNGHVYVIGSAGSPEEYKHLLHILSTVSGVQQVHDYIRLGALSPEQTGNVATGARNWLSKASMEGKAPDPLKGF